MVMSFSERVTHMSEETKNVEVTIYRTVQLRNEDTFVVNVPADVTRDEIEECVEAHIDFEPWNSAAEIDISEVDAADDGEERGIDFVSDESRSTQPDVILVRRPNGRLVMKDLEEGEDEEEEDDEEDEEEDDNE
jgi:hypothetical protein